MATDTQAAEGQLVSRQEAARLAEVHVNTIRLWEESGRLHPLKQENGRVMIPLSELETIVKERHPTGDPEQRVIELEADNGVLRAENTMLRERLAELRREYEELLQTVIDLARREQR